MNKISFALFTIVVLGICTILSSCGHSEESNLPVYQCGDTAKYDYIDLSIGSPTTPLLVQSEYDDREYNAYIKVPIKMVAKEDVKISAKDFGSDVIKSEKDCLPEKLKLKSGDIFEGTLLIDWPSAGDGPGDYPDSITCSNRNCEGIWKMVLGKGNAVRCNSLDEVRKNLPGTRVKLTGRINTIFELSETDDREAQFELDKGQSTYLNLWVPSEDVADFEKYYDEYGVNTQTITIEGTLTNITTTSTGAEMCERAQPYLSDVKIVE